MGEIMATKVNPDFRDEIIELGGDTLNSCMNCGNCTAVCSLPQNGSYFPRRLIRYAQLGMKDRILGDKDIWLCYYCGDCSQTCPRQAEPGELMAAARRYAISQYDVTGLSRILYRSRIAHWGVLAVLSLLFTLLLLWHRGDINGKQLELFKWIPGHVIHDLGVAVFVIVGIACAVGLLNMIRHFFRVQKQSGHTGSLRWSEFPAALGYALAESLGQGRYRACGSLDADKTNGKSPERIAPWLVHSLILWGFLGLLLATTLDYLFRPLETYGSYVQLWHPIRLLGTVAGVVCLTGTSIAIWRRWTRPTKYYSLSRYSDWFLLWLLFATVLTGFVTEVIVYLPHATWFSYIGFLVHVVLAMDLIVLLPMTKFAHVVYRPVALLLHRWLELSEAAATKTATA